MKKFDSNKLILAVDSHFGIYSAQVLAERYGSMVVEDKKSILPVLLSGPEHEDYLDCWDEIESLQFNLDGFIYNVYQNEDIWFIPGDMEFPNEF